MQINHKTFEEAEAELLAAGFRKYQSCIDGRTLFDKEGTVDPFYGAYSKREICSIQMHWIDPQWNGARNYFSIQFH